MDWLQIAVAAVLGAIGGGFGALIGRRFRSKSVGLVAAIVLILVSQAVNRSVVQPILFPLSIDRALLEVAPFEAVKQVDPETYDELVQAVRVGMYSRVTEDMLMGRLQAILNEKIPGYVAAASDEAVLDYYESVVSRLHDISEYSLQACVLVATGQPVGDIRGYLSEETQQTAIDATAALILSSAEDNARASYRRNDAESDLAWVASEVIENDDDLALITGRKSVGLSNPKRGCELQIALYERILALAPDRAAGLLRFLASEFQR